MKKIVLLLTILLTISACGKKVEEKTDAMKFKEEYESLNGLTDMKYPDTTYREVNIDNNNPFVYSSTSEIVKKIENGDSFYIYLGDKMCPWCRSNIESAIKTAKEKGIEKIYYVDMWDDERNEIVRDKYEVVDKELVKTVEGDLNYYKLLEYFDEHLDDYILKVDDFTYEVGEKRITIPAYIHIKGGKVEKYTTATSTNQENSHSELSEDILIDQKNEFSDLFNVSGACSFAPQGGC